MTWPGSMGTVPQGNLSLGGKAEERQARLLRWATTGVDVTPLGTPTAPPHPRMGSSLRGTLRDVRKPWGEWREESAPQMLVFRLCPG